MGKCSLQTAVAGFSLFVLALLSACTGSVGNGSTGSGSVLEGGAVTTTGSTSTAETGRLGGSAVNGTGTQSASAVHDVNCSTSGGKVGPADGGQVDLIAKATEAGRVGCTEAFDVIAEYYQAAPARSEGTARYLVVQGWACAVDSGAHGDKSIACERNGLVFHTA